jgi:hypothetical protein
VYTEPTVVGRDRLKAGAYKGKLVPHDDAETEMIAVVFGIAAVARLAGTADHTLCAG